MNANKNIYALKNAIDGIIERTQFIVNRVNTLAKPADQPTHESWVCFFRSEDSFESELTEHLPQREDLTVTLTDIPYDPLFEGSVGLLAGQLGEPETIIPDGLDTKGWLTEQYLPYFNPDAALASLRSGSPFKEPKVLVKELKVYTSFLQALESHILNSYESGLLPVEFMDILDVVSQMDPAWSIDTLRDSETVRARQPMVHRGTQDTDFPSAFRFLTRLHAREPSDEVTQNLYLEYMDALLDSDDGWAVVKLKKQVLDIVSLPGLATRLRLSKLFGFFFPEISIPIVYFQSGELFIRATTDKGTSPRKFPLKQYRPFSVPEEFIHVLFAIRAVLLALIDSSPNLAGDVDFVGQLPCRGALGALDKLSMWEIDDFVPNCKYWKDYPLASCLDNPLPKVPQSWTKYGLEAGEPLFTNELKNLWRRLCHPLPRSNAATGLFQSAFSIAQSKKAFHPVPDSFVSSAYDKHSDVLSSEAPPVSPEILQRFDKFLRVFFRNFEPKGLIKKLSYKEGSTNASSSMSRAQGGARQEVRELLSHDLISTSQDGLVRLGLGRHGVVEERGLLPPSKHEWLDIIRLPLNHHYERLKSSDSIPEEWKAYPYAQVRGITEPLKVRIITAMDSLSTFVCKPLQKALWDYLARFPMFSLTNQTFQESIFTDLLLYHRKLFGDDSEWNFVSGDYSAATDNLNINATKLVVDHIIRKLRKDDVELVPHIKNIILEQVLIYPGMKNPELMQNGQLMGSILSFPILCIINAFTYFNSIPEECQKSFLQGERPLTELPVLINGDDILFRSNETLYDRWLDTTKEVGFKLSLGKNFVHPRFFTINSLPLEYSRTRNTFRGNMADYARRHGKMWADYDDVSPESEYPLGTFEPFNSFQRLETVNILGVSNLGLLVGLSKTGTGVREDTYPLRGWYEHAVYKSQNPKKMHNFFLEYHRDEVRHQTKFGSKTLNLFAHVLRGGLGFPIPPGVEPRYSNPQRKLAHVLTEAAMSEYIGAPEDNPIVPFTFLELTQPVSSSLGYQPGYVHIGLAAPIGPLMPEVLPYRGDKTILSVTPLADRLWPNSDDNQDLLKPTIRLSNTELHRLLRNAHQGREEMTPIEEMSTFPFRIIEYPGVHKTLKATGKFNPNRNPDFIDEDLITIESGHPPQWHVRQLKGIKQDLHERRRLDPTSFKQPITPKPAVQLVRKQIHLNRVIVVPPPPEPDQLSEYETVEVSQEDLMKLITQSQGIGYLSNLTDSLIEEIDAPKETSLTFFAVENISRDIDSESDDDWENSPLPPAALPVFAEGEEEELIRSVPTNFVNPDYERRRLENRARRDRIREERRLRNERGLGNKISYGKKI